jgi:DNA adenine methylase
MKSPLRYPGGKTRAVETLMEFIPEDCGELCSPFLGGGSFELALAEKGITVYGYDLFAPLVWFWQTLLCDGIKLAAYADACRIENVYLHHAKNKVRRIEARGLPKEDFERYQKEISRTMEKKHQLPYALAAKFYALNRSSFSGATLSGGFSERASYARFTDSSIKRLQEFTESNLTVSHADFRKSIPKHADAYLYVDPPYYLGSSSKLYGNRGDFHGNFPHLELYDILQGREKWILSYNDCELIRHLYGDYQIYKVEWAYGMNKSKQSSEIIITNLPKRLHCVTIDLKGEEHNG